MTAEPAASPRSASLAQWLGQVAIALLVVFLAAVLIPALPPRVLEARWQLQISTVLINNATIALVGFLLLRLAVWIDPEDRALAGRTRFVRRWAIAAALGFVLLVPLQATAAWRAVQTASGNQARQIEQVGSSVEAVRNAVLASTSHGDLQKRLQAIPGLPDASRTLSPSNRATPFAELKRALLAQLQQSEDRLMQRLNAVPPVRGEPLFKESVRLAITALAYAFAFASGSLWRPPSLRLPGRGGRRGGLDADYFQELSKTP